MKVNKRILYISYDGLTDPLGQSQILPYLNLLSKDYIIYILSFEKVENFKLNRNLILKNLGSNLIWIPLRYHKSPTLPATFLDLITGFFTALFYLLTKRIKIIHARSHFVTTFIATILLKIKDARLLFDMRGFWADERVEGNIWPKNKKIYAHIFRFIKKHEKYVIKRADHITVLTSKAKMYLENNFDCKKKITVIPCMADLYLFHYKGEETRSDMRRELKITSGELVITYVGSLGTWYMTNEILDFFKVFKTFAPNAKLLFLTKDSPSILLNYANSKNMSINDIRILSASRAKIPDYLTASDAGIFFVRPTFSKIASSPTKHGELMGCGLPVVCNSKVGDLETIVKESDTGIVIEDFNEIEYKKASDDILRLIKKKSREEISASAKKYYDLPTGVSRYKTIYDQLSGN